MKTDLTDSTELLTTVQAGRHLGLTEAQIRHRIRMGYVKPHYYVKRQTNGKGTRGDMEFLFAAKRLPRPEDLPVRFPRPSRKK